MATRLAIGADGQRIKDKRRNFLTTEHTEYTEKSLEPLRGSGDAVGGAPTDKGQNNEAICLDDFSWAQVLDAFYVMVSLSDPFRVAQQSVRWLRP